MTYNEVINIAKRLDKQTQKEIDKAIEERLEILRQGELDEEELTKMEECLYISLVIQEYLDGEFELLKDEKELLLLEMEEMYNEYGELLTRAKLEEKISKKKRMALELMKIRESLFEKKGIIKEVKEQMKDNRENHDKLQELSSDKSMKEIAKSKDDSNKPKKNDTKIAIEDDMKKETPKKKTSTIEKVIEVEKPVHNETIIVEKQVTITSNKEESKGRIEIFTQGVEICMNQTPSGIENDVVAKAVKEEIDRSRK